MAQIHDEHLTTEQLSASFDKQLSPQEQAVFDAHISTCQQCQSKLSDLRLTAALLHALPEEEVPRSFVLPTSIFIVPDQTIRQDGPFTPIPQKGSYTEIYAPSFDQDRKHTCGCACIVLYHFRHSATNILWWSQFFLDCFLQ